MASAAATSVADAIPYSDGGPMPRSRVFGRLGGMEETGTIIVGGGASGLAAAAFCPGALVLERLPQAGRKILVTGGGRCNLTHEGSAAEIAAAFAGPPAHARFVRPALEAFPPAAQCDWFESLGVPLTVEPGGFVFPASGRAEDVRSALLRAVEASGSRILCGKTVSAIEPRDGGFSVRCADGSSFSARRCILAAGGCARPGLGTDGATRSLAESLGLPVEPFVPALGSLRAQGALEAGGLALRDLAGLTLPDALLRLGKKGPSMRGSLLVTHEGFSGPAALNLCADAAESCRECAAPLTVSWRADRTDPAAWIRLFDEWRGRRGKTLLRNLLAEELPRSLAASLCGVAGGADVSAAQVRAETVRILSTLCAACPFEILSTDGFSACMATRGGVATKALDAKTLEARSLPGLFVVGEACAPVGRCGGYNLAWAWASARLATRG